MVAWRGSRYLSLELRVFHLQRTKVVHHGTARIFWNKLSKVIYNIHGQSIQGFLPVLPNRKITGKTVLLCNR